MSKKESYKLCTDRKTIRFHERLQRRGCPICKPHSGCNRTRRFPHLSPWKTKKVKKQYMRHLDF